MARWKRRPTDRPEEILRAAFAVFRSRGYEHATMDEIAREAGISAGTIYRYFDGKRAMFRALVEQLAARITAEIAEGMGSPPAENIPWPERLRQVAHLIYGNMSRPETMGLLQLVLGEGARMPELPRLFYQRAVKQVQRILIAGLSEGMKRGELRQVDPVVAARTLAGMLMICAMERRILGGARRPHLQPETLIDQVVTIYHDGLGVEKSQ